MTSPQTSPLWQDYLTVVDDVLPWLQMTSSDLAAVTGGAANMQLVTSAVCWWVQDTMGRPVAPTTFTRRFDGWAGWNGAYIELPYYPVLSVSSVTEYWGAGGAHVLTESTPTQQVDGWQLEPLTGRLTRVFPGNVQKPWFPGSRNIEVQWVAGYNPTPPNLRMGTLMAIEWVWRNKFEQPAVHAGVQGEYDAGPNQGMLGGIPDDILDWLFPSEQVGIG